MNTASSLSSTKYKAGSAVPENSSATNTPPLSPTSSSPGTHGGTYGGGSAIPAAAANATIDVILDEDLAGNAAAMGRRLMAGLRDLQAEHPIIGDVRGLGLMVGCEFTTPEGRPDAATTTAVQQACLKRNLLLLNCGSYKNVIRWIPPLVVTAQQIDEALSIFNDALNEAHHHD
jgi:4-aminobutyrate aminotransferase